jgi:ATP-binding cassette subfamily B (MDR/TAP) protein 1
MDITFFDKKGSGVCSAILSNDCTTINNIASSLITSICENLATLVCGLTIAFAACWQMTLVALAVLPVLLIAGKLQLALT